MSGFNLGDYNDVASRLSEFRAKHPEGSLQPMNPGKPYWLETIGSKTFLVYVAAAYRAPDDQRPGIGVAWEEFPGQTNYTRNSELQNAETSAWGRAIVAALAADTKKGVATAEEVRNRQAEREQWDDARPAQVPNGAQVEWFNGLLAGIKASKSPKDITAMARQSKAALRDGSITAAQNDHLAKEGAKKLAELEQEAAS